MGRRRKSWLPNRTGKVVNRGRTLPGYYVYWHDYDPVTGRRILHTRHFLKQPDARRWMNQQNALRDLSALHDTIPILLSKAMAEFLFGYRSASPSTQGDYRCTLVQFGKVVGDMTVSQITGRHIDAYIASRTEKGSSETTAKHCRVLRRFFNWCLDRDYHDYNPLTKATRVPKGGSASERPYFTDEMLQNLIAAINTADRKLAVWLALTTGLDRGNIERLNTHHIDLEHRCIRMIRPKTKGRSKHSIVAPIHVNLWAMILQRLDEENPHQPILLGVSRQRGPRDWWKLALKKAGLSGFRFADLRPAASTRLQRHGVPLTDARDLLGHSSIQTTAKHYSKVNPAVRDIVSMLPLPGFQKEEASCTD